MKKIAFILQMLTLTVAGLMWISCTESPESPDSATLQEFNISGIILVKSVDVEEEGIIELTIVGSNGPEVSDVIRLKAASGKRFDCAIENLLLKSFTFRLPEGVVSGKYELSVVRGNHSKIVGSIQINIIYQQSDIVPDQGATVYGFVHCNNQPLTGVVVSDGYQVTCTDENGIYNLNSRKEHGYIFISVPSGYTVQTDGTLPLFYAYLNNAADIKERVDFSLLDDGNQDSHTMVVMGDIHLANRTDDRTQFMEFVQDLNNYMSANPEEKFYGLTLGDMSWDQFWVTNSYDLTNYLIDISNINGIPVYNTIGNHDHQDVAVGDFNTVVVYKRTIGPTYYSFNIGKVHYVVLDDIQCTNDGTGKRTYIENIVQEQLDWLAKDLSYISADTPVVVATHAPVYKVNGAYRLGNSAKLESLLNGRTVHYMTGHTHIMYNVDKGDMYEHNTGAVCATWWWTDYETPGIHISQDGTPGGYRLLEVDGSDFKWVYKATGKDLSYQFRTYDRNKLYMGAELYVPSANESNITKWKTVAAEYMYYSDTNEVIINIWDYDPEWSIEVTENGKSLPVTKYSGYDPLHLFSYSAPRLNKNKAVTFITEPTAHLFKVVAASADSTLEIKVTDRFGRVYTETMTRPKSFNVTTYK